MGEIYKIVAPPDPALARCKWLWVIAGCLLVLVAVGAIFGPGLYRTARLNLEGPGDGPVLVKRADGKVELVLPPAEVLIGKPYKWRKLLEGSKTRDYLTHIGNFDQDAVDELLVWSSSGPALLYESDGTFTEPGLKESKIPIARVFDWDGDGTDELAVSATDVPLSSWPGHELPRKYADYYGDVFLSVQGEVVGTSATGLVTFGSITGSFTQAGCSQVLRNAVLKAMDLDNNFEQLAELETQPKCFVYGALGKEVGAIAEPEGGAVEILAADLDGDLIDEVLCSGESWSIWQCKFGGAPKKLANWPKYSQPIAVGNIDLIPGDEIISLSTDLQNMGNFKTPATTSATENPVAVEEERQQQEAEALAVKRLEAVGIGQPDYSVSEDPKLSPERRSELRWEIANKYFDQFVMDDSFLPFFDTRLLAWEYFRPSGCIYFVAEQRICRLQIPKFLRWSSIWPAINHLGDYAVVCKASSAQESVVYITPTLGTGLLGFNQHGECVYYEEFERRVTCRGKLQTEDGDYLVLRVGNELLIYP